MSKQIELDSTPVKVGVWSGIVLMVAMFFAMLLMQHFIPPPSPALSPTEIAQKFIERRHMILLACVIECLAWALWTPWGISITLFIRKMEGSFPFLTYTSIAVVGGGQTVFTLIPMTWAVLAFRAETLDPKIIQVANDWVWFDFLYTWPQFGVWIVIIGVAILRDRINVPTLYPRWLAYFNFWVIVLIFGAVLVPLFKTGPFAYNGLGAFWIPMVAFFTWIVTMCVQTMKTINRQKTAQASATQPVVSAA